MYETVTAALSAEKQGFSKQAAQNPTQIVQKTGATGAELVRIADDLRGRFTAEECRRLADLLTDEGKPKGTA